tara:strand:- start:14870 stop:15067 length:198 start_codon:yes stop_codon:yes gene_type:complete
VLCKNVKIGDLVWVNGIEGDSFGSGVGLVIYKKNINLEGAIMVDVYVLCNGKIFPHTNFLSLGER